MPTYEYECRRCGKHFDIFQSITEPPKKRCPECKGRLVRLPGTGAGILFKGSGFYATDYRSESYKKAASAESKSSSSASESSTSKAPKSETSTSKPKPKND